jgi:O-antigen/teichoic acid export membrane protein
VTSDSGRQVRHGLTYLVPVLVGNAAPLITLPIFTRVLGPADYGAWALAAAYASLVAGLANLGLPTVFERNFFEQPDEASKARLLYSVLIFVTGASAAAGIGTWIWQDRIAAWLIGDAALGPLVFWSFVAAAVTMAKMYYLTYFKNASDAAAYVWYSVDETILGVVASLFFVLYARSGVIGLVWGQLVASTAVSLMLFARFRRRHPIDFDPAMLRSAVALGLPLTPRLFVNLAGNQIDKYLIGLVSGVHNVGLFTIGQRVANFAFAYMTALENVFVPQVYRRMFDLGDGGGREIGRYLTPFAYVSAAISLLIALFAEEALFVLTAPEFHGAYVIAALLAVAYGVMFFRKLPQMMFRRRTALISIFSTIAVALNIAVGVPMILRWGSIGAAAGFLIATLLAGVVHYVMSQRQYRIEYDFGALASMFGVLIAAGAVVAWAGQAGVPYPMRLGIKAGLLVAFAMVGVATGVLSRSNLAITRAALLPGGGAPSVPAASIKR